jgi:hypothetical protein
VQPANSFQLGEFITGLGQTGTNATGSVNRVLSFRTGLDGTILNGRFSWDLFYTHGENRLAVDLINNQNLQKMYAAQDAVQLPNGNIACYAATQAATRPDMPTAYRSIPSAPPPISQSAFNYVFQTTAVPPDQYHGRFRRRHLGRSLRRLGRGARHRRSFRRNALQFL